MKPLCSVEKIINKDKKKIIVCDGTRSRLLPILQEIQEKNGYISDRDMQTVADRLDIHPVEVYSVVTFYSFLTTGRAKRGRNRIRVSNCITNVLKGSEKVIKAFEKELKIKIEETTKDDNFTLESTGCLGMCDQAPAIMINDELVGNVTPKKVKEIIKNLKSKKKR